MGANWEVNRTTGSLVTSGNLRSVNNFGSTQWNTTPAATAANPSINFMTLFDNVADKSSGGTLSQLELYISYGITITLTGLDGRADINVSGTDYVATFDTNLFTTASNWVTANEAALNALGIQVFALGSGADGRIRFGSTSDAVLNAITITNTNLSLDGTIGNEFTGSSTASYDHIVVPYVGTPVEGQFVTHNFRINFSTNNAGGSTPDYHSFLFKRWADDSTIGAAYTITQTPGTFPTGNLIALISYTSSPTDSFVTGGFYFELLEDSGTLEIAASAAGMLIQSYFENASSF